MERLCGNTLWKEWKNGLGRRVESPERFLESPLGPLLERWGSKLLERLERFLERFLERRLERFDINCRHFLR